MKKPAASKHRKQVGAEAQGRPLQRIVRRLAETEDRAYLAEQRLKFAMGSLQAISENPRGSLARRLARATVVFIEQVKPVSFGPSMVKPPNAGAKQRPANSEPI